MSLSLYNLKYDLNSELMNENTILYDRENINKLVIAENEDLNHFSCKAILFYILSEMNHDVICDYHIIGVGKVDIFDISARTIYIFEPSGLKDIQKNINELYEESEVEVIAINLEELPDDIFQRCLKLREFVFFD